MKRTPEQTAENNMACLKRWMESQPIVPRTYTGWGIFFAGFFWGSVATVFVIALLEALFA